MAKKRPDIEKIQKMLKRREFVEVVLIAWEFV
jgi:hypothetical protein